MGSSPTSATKGRFFFEQPPKSRPGGQAAKTPPFHGGNTSSILVRVTKKIRICVQIRIFSLSHKIAVFLAPIFLYAIRFTQPYLPLNRKAPAPSRETRELVSYFPKCPFSPIQLMKWNIRRSFVLFCLNKERTPFLFS